MTNQQCRLIASAIVILAGGITFSLGRIANATDSIYGSGGDVMGTIILLVGSALFLSDYIKTLKDTEKN